MFMLMSTFGQNFHNVVLLYKHLERLLSPQKRDGVDDWKGEADPHQQQAHLRHLSALLLQTLHPALQRHHLLLQADHLLGEVRRLHPGYLPFQLFLLLEVVHGDDPGRAFHAHRVQRSRHVAACFLRSELMGAFCESMVVYWKIILVR